MLKSAATVLGIILGILAITDLAVSPSEAQQLRTSIPCKPIVKDWTVCRRGQLLNCTQVVSHYSTGRYTSSQCIRRDRCTPSGKSC
jgi:hypothetical protein